MPVYYSVTCIVGKWIEARRLLITCPLSQSLSALALTNRPAMLKCVLCSGMYVKVFEGVSGWIGGKVSATGVEVVVGRTTCGGCVSSVCLANTFHGDSRA